MAKKKNVVAAHEQTWRVELKADPKALEIVVFDDIGESFFAAGVTAKDVLKSVRSAPDSSDIALRINSRGGILDQAKGMVNILRERQSNGATITAYVDGIAASAASYLLTVADKVVMPSNTFQMIHGARGGARGTAEDFEAYAALLRKTNEQIAEDYAKASQRRGKGKTKEDFLAVFTGKDLYLDADEAIEWGLADEKLEELKIAATTVDLGDLEELAPAALKAAPYVAHQKPAPAAPPTKQLILPAIEARETNATKDQQMNEILMALGLPEDADQATAVSAINKIKASARVGADVEKILGSSGDKAVGAVRALKAGETAQTELAEEIAKVKVQLSKRDFDGEIKNGFDKKKLTPALAKMYNERFDAAVAKGLDGSDVVADLQGYIAHAPSIGALSMRRTGSSAAGTENEGPLAFNGKTFAQMKPMERHNLKGSDPELYAMMREDWEEAGKPAA